MNDHPSANAEFERVDPSLGMMQSNSAGFLLCMMFAGSGLSALIYEIVWFQMLQQVIGASALSLGVLLGTFMGGMCLGSIGFPLWNPSKRHPLRIYAILEVGIGLFAIAILQFMPFVSQLYLESVVPGNSSLVLRACIAALCLLPPTLLMGATLPAIARWVETSQKGVASLGLFYGANIAGGVAGSLLAGFYLLRLFDITIATWVGVAINLIVALVALLLSSLHEYKPVDYVSRATTENDEPDRFAWTIYFGIALSGLSTLGAEVLWTRLLSLILGATTYTFSIILAVFLVGLGLGSSLASATNLSRHRARLAFAWTQIGLGWSIVWAAVMLTQSIPYWPIDPSLSRSPWIMFQLDIVRAAWAMLPASFLWGASFPFALAALSKSGRDPARLVAGVYSANTVGAITGALLFSLIVIRSVGTQGGQKLLVILTLSAALLIAIPLLLERLQSSQSGKKPSGIPMRQRGVGMVAILVAIASFALLKSIHEIPRGLVAYGRYIATWIDEPNYLYMDEGMNASIAVSEDLDGTRSFHVSGKTVASSKSDDMRLQRMLGHLPAFLHRNPKSVLIVGCGAGVTAGTFLLHPSIERIVICEIEPLIPPAANKYFGLENHRVIEDPRVEVVIDDAKHYVRTTTEKFDIITSDPIHPWVKGAASLYSREYYEQVLKHLNPGGIVTQWVPLYETSLDAVQSEVATFFDAFPEGSIWANLSGGAGYDTVMLGQADANPINYEELETRMNLETASEAKQVMEEVGLGNAMQLMLTYAGRKKDMRKWLEKAEINRDRTMRLQYLAGLSSNIQDADAIYRSMLVYRRYPDELFVAPKVPKRALQIVLNDETNRP